MDRTPIRVLLLDSDRRFHLQLCKQLAGDKRGEFRLEWAATPNKAQVAMWLGKYDVCLMSDSFASSVTTPFETEGTHGKEYVPVILLTSPGQPDASMLFPEIGAVDSLPKSSLDARTVSRALRHAVEFTQVKRELWQKQQELDSLRGRYTAFFRNAAHGFGLVRPDWRIEYANPALARILTGDPDATQVVVGLSLETFFPADDDFHAYAASMAAAVRERGRETREVRMCRTDSSPFWAELTIVNMMPEEVDSGLVITVNDVTSRRLAESQIRRQVKRLSALRTIDMAITGSTDLRVTLSVFIEELMGQLGVDAVDVLVLNSRTRMLDYGAGRGFLTLALQNTHLPLGEGCAGKAALEQQVVHVPDLREDEHSFSRAKYLEGEGFVTYIGMPLISKGRAIGVLEVFKRELFTPDQEWLSFLETLAEQAAIAVDSAILFSDLQRSHAELEVAYETTLEGWSRTLELRDFETNEHANRVADMTVRLARETGIADDQLLHLRRGALLHDIGKIGVPDSILRKPGPLDECEREVIQKHPGYAFELLSQIPFLRPSLDIPYCHHEKWDGSGYPRHLAGKQIPLPARIFAVIDVFDALQSDRPYRDPWPREKARAYIEENSGSHFDPEITEAFLATDW